MGVGVGECGTDPEVALKGKKTKKKKVVRMIRIL